MKVQSISFKILKDGTKVIKEEKEIEVKSEDREEGEQPKKTRRSSKKAKG